MCETIRVNNKTRWSKHRPRREPQSIIRLTIRNGADLSGVTGEKEIERKKKKRRGGKKKKRSEARPGVSTIDDSAPLWKTPLTAASVSKASGIDRPRESAATRSAVSKVKRARDDAGRFAITTKGIGETSRSGCSTCWRRGGSS